MVYIININTQIESTRFVYKFVNCKVNKVVNIVRRSVITYSLRCICTCIKGTILCQI